MNGNVQVLGCVRLHKPTKAAQCNFYMNQMGFPEGIAALPVLLAQASTCTFSN